MPSRPRDKSQKADENGSDDRELVARRMEALPTAAEAARPSTASRIAVKKRRLNRVRSEDMATSDPGNESRSGPAETEGLNCGLISTVADIALGLPIVGNAREAVVARVPGSGVYVNVPPSASK